MKIEIEKKVTHGEFAKYMVDKFGISSFGRELAGGDWIGSPSDRYNASINLKTAKYDNFPHGIRIDEDCVTMKTAEEITEDTELNEIFLITNNSIYSERFYNYSINDVLSDNEGYYEELAMLIMQPEPIIIWTHEKGLVE